MLEPDDARRIFEHLVNVEAAKEGRDFIYSVTKTDGTTVSGRLVDCKNSELKLVADGPAGPVAIDVNWDEIDAIQVAGE